MLSLRLRLTQLTLLGLVLVASVGSSAQRHHPARSAHPADVVPATTPAVTSSTLLTASEQAAAAAMERARGQGPAALEAWLRAMPKGGDLHNHLAGAVYAETWLRDAAHDHVCIDPQTLAFAHRPPADSTLATEPCAAGTTAASSLPQNQSLYDELIDSFSMRSFVPMTGDSSHDHFFSSFDRFLGLSESHTPEWVDEVAGRAAAQNEQYLELMNTPGIAFAVIAGAKPVPPGTGYAGWREDLLHNGLREQAASVRAQMDDFETTRRRMERCDSAQPEAACSVQVRYLYQVLRNQKPAAVFAQIVLGFEVVAADLASGHPHYVGLNLVQPEDWQHSMADYTLHMQMIAALRPLYPGVPVSLHAGELAPGLVPPEGLRFHIRQAVEIAGAERIGHGVDVMHEDQPFALLDEMAARHTLVEINLTSNDVILNVKGREHPLPLYLSHGVPVALSTDDEGVSRITLTREYLRAADGFGLGYPELKQMVRHSIEYSFLPGASLWRDHDYHQPQPACASSLQSLQPAAACRELLAANAKAEQQWELERRLRTFETAPPR